jgi:ABC-type multidrug transport system fused ATPase/permease subunit
MSSTTPETLTTRDPAEIRTSESIALLRRAIRYVHPFRWRFAGKLLIGMLSLVPLMLVPWPAKILVDRAIEGIPLGESKTPLPFFIEPFTDVLVDASTLEVVYWCIGVQALLLILVGAIGTSGRENDQAEAYLSSGHDSATRTENEANAGFSLAGGLLGLFDFRWTLRLTQDLNHHYRSRLFERIQALPMVSFDDERVGDAVYRVMYDTPSITNGVYRILLTPVLSIGMILATVAIIRDVFGDHPTLVWSAVAMLPLSFLATAPFAASLRRRSLASRSAGAESTTTVEEGLTNILAVQSLGGNERESKRFDKDSWDSFSEYRSVVRGVMFAVLVATIPGGVIYANAFLYGIDLVISDTISRGDFLLLLSYYGLIFVSAIEIGALWFRIQGSTAGLQRVFYLMDLPGERDIEGARDLDAVRESIRLDDVSFRFADGTLAVDHVSFEARLGEVTALVGPAGAGKTTLAHLLCGYLVPSSGSVELDGVPLREFKREALRQQIGFVFQETALFDDSIADNLRLGAPHATEAEMRAATLLSGATEFIDALPQGYDTPLGRSGSKLSVGQKQRLSIARALIRPASVLVLDEPTSALDSTTERHLARTIEEVGREKLVVVIAHRLSTIRNANQILFVEHGRIIERGSHAELMAMQDGAYRHFVELQMGGRDRNASSV